MSIDWGQREKALNDKIIDRIASDPQFAQQLKSNPEQALQSAGLAQEAEQLAAAMPEEGETGGYNYGWSAICGCLGWTSYRYSGKKKKK